MYTAQILFGASRVLSAATTAHSYRTSHSYRAIHLQSLPDPRCLGLPPLPSVTRGYHRASATPTLAAKTPTPSTLSFSADLPPSYTEEHKDPTYSFLTQQLGLTPEQLIALKSSIVSVLSDNQDLRELNLHSCYDRARFAEELTRLCRFPKRVVKAVERSSAARDGVAGYLCYRVAVKVRKTGKLGKTGCERRTELEV
jgi:hypothetical protein